MKGFSPNLLQCNRIRGEIDRNTNYASYRYNTVMSEKIQTETLVKTIACNNVKIEYLFEKTRYYIGNRVYKIKFEKQKNIYYRKQVVRKIRTYQEYVQNKKEIEEIHKEKTNKKRYVNKGYTFPLDFYQNEEIIKRYEELSILKERLNNGQHEDIIKEYLNWVREDIALVFEVKERVTNNLDYSVVLASKRGNRMYAYMMKERLDDFNRCLTTYKFFDSKQTQKRHKTPIFKGTLTFDPKGIECYDAWEKSGKYYNNFMSKIRQEYGKSTQIRSWETHKSGYPHIHFIVLLGEKQLKTFFIPTKDRKLLKRGIKGTWRLTDKEKIDKFWVHGHTDLRAISKIDGSEDLIEDETDLSITSLSHDLKYLTKGLKKEIKKEDKKQYKQILQFAIMWKMRKKSFSMSHSGNIKTIQGKKVSYKGFIEKYAEVVDLLVKRNGYSNNELEFYMELIEKRRKITEKTHEIEYIGAFNMFHPFIRRGRPPPEFLHYRMEQERSSEKNG